MKMLLIGYLLLCAPTLLFAWVLCRVAARADQAAEASIINHRSPITNLKKGIHK